MRPMDRMSLMVFFLLLGGANASAFAQANFYEGKTVRVIVGLAAGGGYDVYARTHCPSSRQTYCGASRRRRR